MVFGIVQWDPMDQHQSLKLLEGVKKLRTYSYLAAQETFQAIYCKV